MPIHQSSLSHKLVFIVREPNSENCLDLIFAAPLARGLSLYQVQIKSAITKFMLEMPSPGSFQNIDFLICVQQGSEHVKPFGSNWVKL